MAIFGLGSKVQTVKKDEQKQEDKTGKPAASASQSDEAKAMLAKMQAKKDAGDCPFC